MSNVVAIVGRPNVGKSTFFNRLVGARDAIMHNESGVTRDRHYGYGDWNGREFVVIDTGGYVEGSDDKYEAAIRNQVMIAMEEADVIIFLVDCVTGIIGMDEEFANIVRRSKKPTFLVANKADTTERQQMIGEFYSLGIGDMVYPVSSQSGKGTGDLLDDVVKALPKEDVPDPLKGLPRLSVVGRPNCGKSSLVNLLLGKDRSIVTDEAGTTRDSVHSHYKGFGNEFVLVDTAGLRKKGKVKENIEFYSNLRSIKSIEDSDVCMAMIDAERGIEAQDVNIISLIIRNGKGLIILINKWDLIEKETNTAKEFEAMIREKIPHASFAPIIFISVLEKQRIQKGVQKAIEIFESKKQKLPTSVLNKELLPIIERTPPPSYRGKYIKIKYITQLPTYKPVFAFFCNHPKHIQESYAKFLESQMRQKFDFEGVPIKLVFRAK